MMERALMEAHGERNRFAAGLIRYLYLLTVP
jgi:hypothetical protein